MGFIAYLRVFLNEAMHFEVTIRLMGFEVKLFFIVFCILLLSVKWLNSSTIKIGILNLNIRPLGSTERCLYMMEFYLDVWWEVASNDCASQRHGNSLLLNLFLLHLGDIPLYLPSSWFTFRFLKLILVIFNDFNDNAFSILDLNLILNDLVGFAIELVLQIIGFLYILDNSVVLVANKLIVVAVKFLVNTWHFFIHVFA